VKSGTGATPDTILASLLVAPVIGVGCAVAVAYRFEALPYSYLIGVPAAPLFAVLYGVARRNQAGPTLALAFAALLITLVLVGVLLALFIAWLSLEFGSGSV
jgi:hypothetical protein